MGWERIARGKAHVVGIDAGDPSRLEVRVPLDGQPPAEWAAFFVAPVRVRIDATMAPPVLDGSAIYLRPRDAELDIYIRQLDALIAAANDYYERAVVPRLRTQQPRDSDRTARAADRLALARQAVGRL